jgi:RimJ/RimL family protein N-acetyltransferase
MQAVLAWADARGLTERSVCIIDPTNAASVRVAEKCGYREFARTQFGDGDVVMLERVVSVVP